MQRGLIIATGWLAAVTYFGSLAEGEDDVTANVRSLGATFLVTGFHAGWDGDSNTRRLGSGQTQVSLELRNEVRDVPGATHTSRAFLEISLLASGDVDARQVLVQREQAAIFGAGGEGRRSLQPLLRTSDVEALAIYGDLLFRWKPPAGEEKADAVEPLTWEWKQSAMALSGTGKTVLKHQARGGKGPLKYSLESAYDALSVDEKTGEVTVDEAALLGEAAENVEQQIVASAPPGTLLLDTFRAAAPGMVTRAYAILGRKPKGAPVAIPIRVEVSDSAGDSATLQYYVLAEVSSSELQARLKQLDDERKKQIEEQQKKLAERPMPMPIRRGAVEEGNPDDPAALRRRIDSLEQRLDLMTRQLNEVLKKLER